MVDYIADYLETIRERRVFPDVKPGYMRDLISDSAPVEGEDWESIFKDVDRVIMPGVTHWQSPHMHAYFPALNSYPSLLGDMLADGINCLGFTWVNMIVQNFIEREVYITAWQFPGIQSCLYRVGVHCHGLARQNDWVARGVSALQTSQSGRRSYPDNRLRVDFRLFVGWPDWSNQEVPKDVPRNGGCGDQQSLGGLLLRSSPFVGGESRSDRTGQDQVHWIWWQPQPARGQTQGSHRFWSGKWPNSIFRE